MASKPPPLKLGHYHFLPVVGVLCALCDTRTIDFDFLATALFTDWSVNTQEFLRKIHTQEFLRKIRVKP